MWVSKITELIGSSPESFDDAASRLVERADRTVRGITGIEILSKRVRVENDAIAEYRLRVRLTFDVAPTDGLHL
jgi:flavin-binding protein dodecin